MDHVAVLSMPRTYVAENRHGSLVVSCRVVASLGKAQLLSQRILPENCLHTAETLS